MLMNLADASMSISIFYLSFLQVNWFLLKVEYSGSKFGIPVQIPSVIGLVEHVYTVQYVCQAICSDAVRVLKGKRNWNFLESMED